MCAKPFFWVWLCVQPWNIRWVSLDTKWFWCPPIVSLIISPHSMCDPWQYRNGAFLWFTYWFSQCSKISSSDFIRFEEIFCCAFRGFVHFGVHKHRFMSHIIDNEQGLGMHGDFSVFTYWFSHYSMIFSYIGWLKWIF